MPVLFPSGGRFPAGCGRRTLKHPWFQLWVLLLSITSAGTVGTHMGEGRGTANVLPRPPPAPSCPSCPSTLAPISRPPQTLPLWSICLCLVSGGSAISSHIAQMVSMRASVNSSGLVFFFCNCQFPYQSVCISMVGREREREKNLSCQPPPSPPLPGSFVLIKGYCCLCCWWGNAGLCSWLCACVREREASVGVGRTCT